MGNKLKSKRVLISSEFSELAVGFIKLLLDQAVKAVTVINGDPEGFDAVKEVIGSDKVTHILADVKKIEDLEVVYEKILKTDKKLDIIVNTREIRADDNWEDEITIHINSLICNTLMAIKHLGKMNSGKGGLVLNAISVYDVDTNDNPRYRGICNLLENLDKSFGNSYYYQTTGLQILTMCANMGNKDPDPAGATCSTFNGCEGAGAALLRVLLERRSDLRIGDKSDVEEFQISVGN